MTRRGKMKVEDDPQVQLLLDAETPAVTIVGKTWPLHVIEVFGVTLEENLAMIADTVALSEKARARGALRRGAFLRQLQGRSRLLARRRVKAARDAGADLVVLCDTNGGSLPEFVERSDARGDRRSSASPSASTRTTMAASAWPMRSRRCARARCRCRARSTATASASGTATSRRSCRTCSSRWASTVGLDLTQAARAVALRR